LALTQNGVFVIAEESPAVAPLCIPVFNGSLHSVTVYILKMVVIECNAIPGCRRPDYVYSPFAEAAGVRKMPEYFVPGVL
jgi:hypothetical protein